jgi:hypothetical protein
MPVVQSIKVYRGEDIELNFTMVPARDITGWVISMTIAKAFDISNKLIQVTAFATNAPLGKYTVILTSAQLDIHPDSLVYDVFRINPGNRRILNEGPFIIGSDARFPV